MAVVKVILVLFLAAVAHSQLVQWRCDYTLAIKTADESGAGTDGSVSAILQRSNTPVSLEPEYIRFDDLDNPGNDFERNSFDTYTREGACVRPCRLTLVLDPSGFAPGWRPEYVNVTVSPQVVNSITGVFNQKANFNFRNWLGNANTNSDSAENFNC